ncbi:MAG: hypothetical protein LBP87_03140 [Planctomycetaceae bacterium]|nr:hypothetical protein [Planctomycetaceae bacterium]
MQQFVQNKIFRWLLSTAIFCYVIVPKIGACYCLDCRCNQDNGLQQTTVTETIVAETTATAEDSTDSVCCSSNCCSEEPEISTAETVTVVSHSCCSQMLTDAVPADIQDKSPVCPCSLKSVSKQLTFISPSSISFRQNSDELLTDGYSPYSFSQLSIPVIKIVVFYLFYESPVSRLPVRLHLLLLVLLN